MLQHHRATPCKFINIPPGVTPCVHVELLLESNRGEQLLHRCVRSHRNIVCIKQVCQSQKIFWATISELISVLKPHNCYMKYFIGQDKYLCF